MITQDTTTIQQETVANISQGAPLVLVNSDTDAYILVKNLSAELEQFILTGNSDSITLSVFSEAYEKELIEQWRSCGLEYQHRSQQIEYMNRKRMIEYLQVSNPQTGVKISLIPWFMLLGRPYPVFVYVYAIWHYTKSSPKSMQLSAAVTGAIFGVSSFNKGTLSRNLKAMEQLISSFQMDRPLSINEPNGPSSDELIGRIHELLVYCPTTGSLIEACGARSGQAPSSINRAGTIANALSQIPSELIETVANSGKGANPSKVKSSAIRHKKDKQHQQHKACFVDPAQFKETRQAFISVCKAIILDATATFHRFLI